MSPLVILSQERYLMDTTPSSRSRRGKSRPNKANNLVSSKRGAVDVHIQSAIRPYRSDPIIRNFKIRYQCSNTFSAQYSQNFTRGFILSTMFVGRGGTNTGIRLFSGVRIVSIKLFTAAFAEFQWLSQYVPTSSVTVNGTSTTSPGVLESSPPANSTASFWSTSGNNESENLFYMNATKNDYVDVHYQVVFFDNETVVTNVTTTNTQATGQVYRSCLDGPTAAFTSAWVPTAVTSVV